MQDIRPGHLTDTRHMNKCKDGSHFERAFHATMFKYVRIASKKPYMIQREILFRLGRPGKRAMPAEKREQEPSYDRTCDSR